MTRAWRPALLAALVLGAALAPPLRAAATAPAAPSLAPSLLPSLAPTIVPSLSPPPLPSLSPAPTGGSPAPSPRPLGSPSPSPTAATSPVVTGIPGGTAPDPRPSRQAPAPSTTAAAQPAGSPAVIGDSVVHSVIRSIPAQVPVFPVLLPLFAALFLLLVSAGLAAYRRTQEARRLERLEQTKSDFLKLASHELRTPLTVLLGYVSMIRDGDVRPDTPAFWKAMPIIEDRLNQVNTIVEQMLEAARLEEGPDRLHLERFDFAGLVADSVLAVRARVGGSHLVEVRNGARSLVVHADRGRVGAIVDQLLDNAVKYSPEGGRIACSIATARGHASLTVRDRGIGIAGDDLERVFTRFGRLVTRDNSHIPGTGLGLYLARENARRLGGDITVVSRPGRGSAFTLTLPLDADPPPGPAGAAVQLGS